MIKEINLNNINNEEFKEKLIEKEKPITLEVNENNLPAISLYKKYGFKEVAKRKGYYSGIDAILMEKK